MPKPTRWKQRATLNFTKLDAHGYKKKLEPRGSSLQRLTSVSKNDSTY